jgi:Transposase
MQVTTIGLDIAKSVFQVHRMDERGRVVLRKRLARAKVLAFFANLPPCRIGLEACGGGASLGARADPARPRRPADAAAVRKAYVKTNKHNATDAEACCEAVQRPSMRLVAVKTEAHQASLMLHRVRDQLIGQRTATINALRGHLAELGIVAAQRQAGLRERRPFNVVVAAVANKLARIICAMLSRGEAYRPPRAAARDQIPGRVGRMRRLRTRWTSTSCAGDLRREGSIARTEAGRTRGVHEPRARSHDRAPVRGSHQGQRPTRRTPRPNGSQQPDHTARTSRKSLHGGRRPWMDHPKKELRPQRLRTG